MIVDGRGRPLKVMITPGQQGDITTAPALLEGIPARHVLADKAYDSNALRALIKAKRAKAVIPSNRTRKKLIRHDKAIYKMRNQIERCIGSRTSDASLHAMIAGQVASSPSYTSRAQCSGRHECRFVLGRRSFAARAE